MRRIILILIAFISLSVSAQQVYFQEGFENESNRIKWTQEHVGISNASWDFTNGGVKPPVPPGFPEPDALPASAVNGSYNARFFKQSPLIHETYLISPTFSLELSQKPQFRFYYAQYPNEIPGGDKDNSKFTLCYRTPDYGNQWIDLKDYHIATEGWVFDSLPFPDSLKYSEIQIGFRGLSATVSFSTCIDSIMIIETDTVDKHVDQIYANHPNQDIVPTGSHDNPILQVHLPVKGNNSELFLRKLSVEALLETEQLVPAKGVHMYVTQTNYFTRDNPLGDTVSFVNGTATFSNLNYSLPFGDNYLWITVDIAEDTEHKFKGLKIDAKIPKNGIQLNDKFFSSESDLDPNGYREVNESVFYDDFESTINWTLVPEFEIDSAYGKGGDQQNPDPHYATSGFKIMGTDLTGLGNIAGDYEPKVSPDSTIAPPTYLYPAYTATSQTFDCSFFKDLNLQFYRWLNISADDKVKIEYSTTNGMDWITLWESTTLIAESNWHFIKHSLSSSIDRAPSVTFRFSLGPTGIGANYSGWNIDNFALTGNYVNNDVGVAEFITPQEGSGLTNNETVTVKLKNFGYDTSSDVIPVGYSIDNGYSWTIDTLHQALNQGEEYTFSFSQGVDLSNPGEYRILVSTLLETDEDSRNDLIDTTIYSTQYSNIPYVDNFESGLKTWRSGGTNNSWELGVPSDTLIPSAFSGSNAWVTNLSGDYNNNESSWLEGPSFNFTGIEKPVFECKILTAGETNKDGLALYYSLDEGDTWVLVPEHTGSYNWNWYNNENTISALGHEGWDIADNNWFLAREVLPAAVANQPKVRLRFVFKSDASGTSEGFAIDDIRVYNAPTDAGISSVTDPVSSCTLSEEQQITVRITNYGIRKIIATDTLFASVNINDDITLSDTFIVSTPINTGSFDDFTFTGTYDMSEKNDYIMNASVNATGDTSYYNTNNNKHTATASITGEPDYTLGPDIGTLNPQSVQIDAGSGFNTYNWKNLYNDSTATGRYFDVLAFPGGVFEMNFAVIAQKSNGCTSYDTVRVMKSVDDLGVISATGLSSTCFHGITGQDLEITLQNYSTDTTYQINDKIVVACEVNEDNITYDTITLSSTLGYNETLIHSFSKKILYPEAGTYNVKVYPELYGDLDFSNDTTNHIIDIYKSADIDFGADTIFTLRADTITLDVGENLMNIYWLGSATQGSRTYPIATNHSAMYFAEATDINGCYTDIDTIHIVGDNWKLSNITPVDMCNPSASEQVTITIKNESNNSYNAGSKTIRANVSFDGNTLEENIIIPAMSPGETVNHTFSQSVDMSEVKAYPVLARIFPDNDIRTGDNLISKNINIWGTKAVDLGEDIISKRADTITLDPGTFYKTYEWQDGSNLSKFKISRTQSATYWVDVEDYNNCTSSRDSVQVFASDISVVNILSPGKSCNVENLSLLKFTIENSGNDVITSGENIIISYQIDNRPVETLNYALANDLPVGYKRNISVNNDFNFNPSQNHTFNLSARISNDFFPENDSASVAVFQLDVPMVDLGDDIIYTAQADSITLTAPAGYSAYRWQDGSRQETFDITNTGSYAYWVKVTNDNNCSTTDSVTIIAGDILLASVTGIIEENCTGTQYSDTIEVEYPLTFEVQVTGADTLRAGQSIKFYYTTNNGYIEYKNILLADNYYAGKSYTYTFSSKMKRGIGKYDFSAWIEVSNDFDFSNNIYSSSFDIGPFDIGLEDEIQSIEEYETLKANSGFSTYSWSTGETSDSIIVYESNKYYVEAFPDFNCPSIDSTDVIFSGNRALTEITNINSAECISANPVAPVIQVKNIGDSVWRAAQTIKYIYAYNGGANYVENPIITSSVSRNETLSHTLSQPMSLANSGTNTLRLRIDVNNVTVSDRTFTVAVSDPPVFSFISDTIVAEIYPVTLDPGIDNVTYDWSNGAKTKTIQAMSDGTYTLTVTNAGGCSYTREVSTRIGIHVKDKIGFNASIYPNPTNSRLYISLDQEFRNVNVQVTDVRGRIVMLDRISNNGTKILEVSNWDPGVYLVKLFNDEQQSVHRIIVTD